MNKVLTAASIASIMLLTTACGEKKTATTDAVKEVIASATPATSTKEKCYGVVKAGKNDCATKTSSCAGTSKTDYQKDAFIALPKGLCDKLAGGSLTSS